MDENILIIEDEPALVEALSYNLKKEGHHVETAGDGISAIETARRRLCQDARSSFEN